jgi:hypothetical protein
MARTGLEFVHDPPFSWLDWMCLSGAAVLTIWQTYRFIAGLF